MNLELLRPRPSRASVARRLAAAGLAATAIIALSGCATDEPSSPKPSTSASSSPTPSPTASPGSTAEPTPSAPAEEATPIGITCTELLTADDIYAYNPNLALVDGQTPESGSPAARAVAVGGIACHYMNLTSNEQIIVSVSNPGPTALEQVRSSLSGSATPADGLGGEGWFGDGTATVIAGPHLVTASSEVFFAAADAQQLTTTAISRLG